MIQRTFALTFGAACLLLAYPALAQPASNTTGLFLNAHINGTSIGYDFGDLDDDIDETDEGGGLGIQIGYGFSPLVTLYLSANGSNMETDNGDTYGLGHVDAGVRFNFRSGRKGVPYVNIAGSYRQATFEVGNRGGEVDFSGGGLTVGGGLAYFLSPQLALDAGLQITLGTFTDVRVGSITADVLDVDAGSGRLALGLSWFPTRR